MLRVLTMSVVLVATIVAFNPFPAMAEEFVDSYLARLSEEDHYNSKGTRLHSAAAIIRQDRANFHRFGLRDPEDQSDTVFHTTAGRARLEAMLKGSQAEQEVLRQIINGTPLVRVEIYTDHIEVTLQ